jgi:hypothetical protein
MHTSRGRAGGDAARACEVTTSSTSCLVASRAVARASPSVSARCCSSRGKRAACFARPPGPAATCACRAATTASATCIHTARQSRASGANGRQEDGRQKCTLRGPARSHPPLRCRRATAAPPPRRTLQLPGGHSARRRGKLPAGAGAGVQQQRELSAQVSSGARQKQRQPAGARTLQASAASSRSFGDFACWAAARTASIPA